MKSILSYFFNILKVKDKKIVFSNFNGKGYGCNPKYITEEFIRRNKGYDIVWLTKEDPAEFPKEVRVVKWGGLQAIYEWSTAKVIVNNVRMGGYFAKGFKKKREQIYIQTWHGSLGIKKMEADSNKLNVRYIEKAKIDSKNIDVLLSNSEWNTKLLERCFWYRGSIAGIGSPRNSVLFSFNYNDTARIKCKIGVHDKTKIILYAPTFFDDDKTCFPHLNYATLIKAFEEKYNSKCIVLLRCHPSVELRHVNNDKVINVSDYSDIQELLLVSDCLITNYSSCAFDYIHLKRPVFIYAPDINEYIKERGLYFDYSETPFEVSKTEEELISIICQFNEYGYKERCESFIRNKKCYDSVDSARLANIVIKEYIEKKE